MSVNEIHVYIIWVFCQCICLCMRYMYISLGVLSVYEIHVYIIWVFCMYICLRDTYIYHLGVLYGGGSYEIHILYIYPVGVLSDFRNVPACTVYYHCSGFSEWSRGCFFFRKNIIISYFRFELRLPLTRTAVTWTECCQYGVKHKTINQSFVGEELWSIVFTYIEILFKTNCEPKHF